MRVNLQWKITFLTFGVVLASILFAGFLLAWKTKADFQNELGERALAIGRTVAQSSLIINSVGKPGGEKVIQPLAEKIRLATNVDYIVVLDMDHKRYSHPVTNRIGNRFAGGDEGPAFADTEYISQARGVLGESVRAFVPIKDQDSTVQIGVVVVGILTPSLKEILFEMKVGIYSSLLFGLMLGAGGAVALARTIKKAILGLEPEEIATLVEQREAMVQAISEGIVAIDQECRITLINDAAAKILDIKHDEALGRPILELIPHSRLPKVIEEGLPRLNQEVPVGSKIVMSNLVPIYLKGKIAGAVAVFRDKTEVRKLAEELTGVKKFVEALRVQNHENLNKLHTIAGLIQLERNEEALDFIFKTTEAQQELTGFLTKNVKDYGVAGLLLGKFLRALELGITLDFDPHTRLDRLPVQLVSSDLVVIIGNLLENAMEAVANLPQERRHIIFKMLEQGDMLVLIVKDRGPGIAQDDLEGIFQHGFSTKCSQNRGIGLFLVKNLVESVNGTITVDTTPAEGTTFIISLPLKEDETDEQH